MGGVWQNCCCGRVGQLELVAALPNCGQNYYIGHAPGEPNPAYDRTRRFGRITIESGLLDLSTDPPTEGPVLRTGFAEYNPFARGWIVTDPGREAYRAALQAALDATHTPHDEPAWSEEYAAESSTRTYGWIDDRPIYAVYRPVGWERIYVSNPLDWDILAALMHAKASDLWPQVATGTSTIFMWRWATTHDPLQSAWDGGFVPYQQAPVGGPNSVYAMKIRAGISDTAAFDPNMDGLPLVTWIGFSDAFFGFFGGPVDGAHTGATSGFIDFIEVKGTPGNHCVASARQNPDYGSQVWPIEPGDWRFDNLNGYGGGGDGYAGWIFPIAEGFDTLGHGLENSPTGLIEAPASFWGVKEIFLAGGGPC